MKNVDGLVPKDTTAKATAATAVPVVPEVKSRPTTKAGSTPERESLERQTSRPRCHICKQLMTAKSSPGIHTLYKCDNAECGNNQPKLVSRMPKQTVNQHQDFRAREDM